jgi:serine protease Do
MNRFALGTSALLYLASSATAVAAPPAAPAPAASSTPATMAAPGALTPFPRGQYGSRKELVRRILPHNVRLALVEGGKARRTASGVVIARERTEAGVVAYVVTNAHAVDEGGLKSPSLVVLVDGRGRSKEYAAEVVTRGSVPDMDLALLRVAGLDLPPAQLAGDEEPEPGEDVVVAASPFGRPLSLSGGMVSQVEWDEQGRLPRMLKTDAPIGYGASGGGIFSVETGRLLAIVEGYRTAKVGIEVAAQTYSFDVPMPGETFAAPSSKVRQFLESRGLSRLLTGGAQAPADEQQAALK